MFHKGDEEEVVVADEPGLNLIANESNNKVIRWMKFAALMFLAMTGLGLAWLAHALTHKQEVSSFDTAFRYQAREMIDAFYSRTFHQMWISFTTQALVVSNDGNLPFVTVPHFEKSVSKDSSFARASSISWAPLLRNQLDRKNWELYANHQTEAAGYIPYFYPNTDSNWQERDIQDGIFAFYNGTWPAQRQGPGPYSPIWQSAPIAKTRRAVLFDQFAEPIRAKALTQMLDLEQPMLTSFLDQKFEDKITIDYHGPRSIIIFPKNGKSRIVGSIQTEFEWKHVFEGASEESLIVVLSNSCGETATFETHGTTVRYLGPDGPQPHNSATQKTQSSSGEEQHQSWEYLFESVDATPAQRDEFFSRVKNIGTHDSQGWALCKYSISVYPAQDFEDRFFTAKPTMHALTLLMVFGFCMLLFVIYEYSVRRQRDRLDVMSGRK